MSSMTTNEITSVCEKVRIGSIIRVNYCFAGRNHYYEGRVISRTVDEKGPANIQFEDRGALSRWNSRLRWEFGIGEVSSVVLIER